MRYLKILVTIFLLLFSCKEQQYVISNAVKGRVISISKIPINGVTIYVDKFSSNAFEVKTDKDGFFIYTGLKMPYKYLNMQNRISNEFHIEKEGYKNKIIYVQNLRGMGMVMDTINLGDIYLEKIE